MALRWFLRVILASFPQWPLAALLAATLLALPAAGRGEQWNRFRGPNGQGICNGIELPATWTDTDYRWQVDLPGRGHGSPVISQGVVFVASASGEDGRQFLEAYQLDDGQRLWRRELPGAAHPKHEFNSFASSTPTVDDQHVYYAWATPEHLRLKAVDRHSGVDVWQRDFGPFVSEHGFGASPILFEDLVILPNEQDGESFVVAVERGSGETRWQTPRRTEKAAYATPCVYRPPGGDPQLVCASWAHGLYALDPRSGEPLWEQPAFRFRVVASPTLAGNVVFGSSGVGGVGRQLVGVRIPSSPDESPEVAYDLRGSLPYVPCCLVRGNLLFTFYDKGIATCTDLSSGETVWRKRVEGEFFSSPVFVHGKIYIVTRSGEAVVLAADRAFAELGRVDLGEASHSTPAVAEGVMILRTFSRIMALPGQVQGPGETM